MKKFTAVLLLVVMIFSLVACGEEQKAEKYCWNCGEGITKTASFCEHCGTKINENQSTNTSFGADEIESSSTIESYDDISKTEDSHPEEPPRDVSEESTESSENESSLSPETSAEPEESVEPEPPAHTHTYSKKVTEPTCTEKGYTIYTCSCGNSYKGDYVSASHNYVNYKCEKCGTIDSSHSFAYLSQWLLNNGTTYGEYVYIESYFDEDVISIKYYPNAGDIVFAYSGYESDNFVLTHLYIYEGSKNITYISGSETARISGEINMSSYTEAQPLTYDSCEPGEYETTYNMLESTRLRINNLLTGVEYMLAWEDVGLSIKDIGFTSFDVK